MMRVAHSSTGLGDDITFSAPRVLSCLGLRSVDHVVAAPACGRSWHHQVIRYLVSQPPEFSPGPLPAPWHGLVEDSRLAVSKGT
jgi:hypothetical protein